MMRAAVIFSADNPSHDDRYELTACLLCKSIRMYHPDIDIYCGVYTSNKLSQYVVDELNQFDVKMVYDIIIDDSRDLMCRSTRLYCQTHLTEQIIDSYDLIIYLDTDIILLQPIDFERLSRELDSIFLYEWPVESLYIDNSMIQEESCGELVDLNKGLYFNFFHLIHKNNRHVFSDAWRSVNVEQDTYNYNTEIKFHAAASSYANKIINDEICCYYPCLPPTKNTRFFHYDTLSDRKSTGSCNTFNRISNIFPETHSLCKKYLEKFSVEIVSDGYCNERVYKKRAKELLPYTLMNKDKKITKWIRELHKIK